MSKMDNLRAMREARYQAAAARAPKPAASSATDARRSSRAAKAQPSVETPDETGPALCGHRAISGRTCTREAGHASKSHRYS